ncbi:beta-galactosidase trimerization domain-containing protein [Arcticibacter eurypsychrophilus]|uniref:beta-galactosidase trimerization domain-containing protein n=1 Tax=Arcticibacter eurypsychrophilus TaxID=1434752 RepID=UPI00084DBD9E|nr:beta-galactosidase trimerization domain-containing protein [Arcticibacter eurypsychrophilus]
MDSLLTAPEIGAEIFIEPGQTDQEIDTWFRQMKDLGLSITRIRMFENYMHQPDGSWDFSLFDKAFLAGEKYGIAIYANLFPATTFDDVGGFKFPKTEENLHQIADYIKHLVTHFSAFPALYGWVPINEPGSGELPDDTFTQDRFVTWKAQQTPAQYNSKGYTHFNFEEQRFLLEYNSWFLKWLIDEIRRYDSERPIHVNNHAIFKNAAEYDFPQWRNFLSSLGGSAHASWHYGYFTRQKYALAMSANSEMLRSGAGGVIPWMMTELQGGNNTYSGISPMCPTRFETAQWLWTTIGSGSKGSIFWCLNPRLSGFEAGEWAMLDFQDQPSDRLLAASAVANTITANHTLFAGANPIDSGIHVVYTRESMWIEQKLQIPGDLHEGRSIGGVIKSALSYFEALSDMGIHASFKEMSEFDFDQDDYSKQAIILAHQISVPSRYWEKIHRFVSQGGKLIVEGLTGYYDENAYCLLRAGFPFKELFGGEIKEFKVVAPLFDLHLSSPDLKLKAHLWQGTLNLTTAKVMGTSVNEAVASQNTYENEVIASLKGHENEVIVSSNRSGNQVIASWNAYGKGEVLWIPSLIGMGARITNDYTALTDLLYQELAPLLKNQPALFDHIQQDVIMKTMRSGNSYLFVIINKSTTIRWIKLKTNNLSKDPLIIYADQNGRVSAQNEIEIHSEETMVLKWDLDVS